MLCFRRIGKVFTGASYAVMSYGPELNNYRDLVRQHIDSVPSFPVIEKRLVLRSASLTIFRANFAT